MAPQAANKRASAECAPAEKRIKLDPMFEGVVDAIQQADLTDSCKRMLTAMLPHSLGIPADQRHELQAMGIQAIEEVFDGIKSTMQGEIDAEAGNVADAEAAKAKLQGNIDQVQSKIEQIEADLAANKKVLLDHSMVLLQKRPVLAKAQQDVNKGDVELNAALAEKEGLEAAKAEHLQPLLGTDAEDERTTHYEGLKPFLPALNMEDSLRNAVPGTVCKPSSERGMFDTMVLEQLESSFGGRLAALEKVIEDEKPASLERAKVLSIAQEEHDIVKSKCHDAASRLTTVQLLMQEAEAEKDAAELAAAEYEPQYTKATAVRDQKTQVLEAFQTYNYESFKTCRDRTAPQTGKSADLDIMQPVEEASVAEAGA